MTATGERYTVARAAFTPQVAEPAKPPTRWRWIELLGHPQRNQRAFTVLEALPPDELRPLAIAGTRHANPKIRRRSCRPEREGPPRRRHESRVGRAVVWRTSSERVGPGVGQSKDPSAEAEGSLGCPWGERAGQLADS